MSENSFKGLELNEDFQFQLKTWRVQRFGWIIMAFTVIAGTAGAFGSGVLSKSQILKEDIIIEYDRLSRYETTAKITFYTQPAIGDSVVKIWISRDYIDEMQVEQITPEPESNQVTADRIIYSFLLSKRSERVKISCHLKTAKIGFLKARTGIEGGDEVVFTQFVYP